MAQARREPRSDIVSLRVRVAGGDRRVQADRIVAETFEAGARGYQEWDDEEPLALTLLVYVDAASCHAVCSALESVSEDGVEVGPVVAVDPIDWVSQWRDGLRAWVVEDRLRIRPEAVEADRGSGMEELVIEPGQAFGTGSHATTRLALKALVSTAGQWDSAVRVLDVGTGTGILALSALRLGARWALGCDIDFQACVEASRWARRNGLSDRFDTWTGSLESLSGARFGVVVANLLRREMLPLADALASRLTENGYLVVSGLLVAEREEVEAVFETRGLCVEAAWFERDDARDEWLALVLRPASRVP